MILGKKGYGEGWSRQIDNRYLKDDLCYNEATE